MNRPNTPDTIREEPGPEGNGMSPTIQERIAKVLAEHFDVDLERVWDDSQVGYFMRVICAGCREEISTTHRAHQAAVLAGVVAQAIRVAAHEFYSRVPNGQAYSGYEVSEILNARADRIEKGEGA